MMKMNIETRSSFLLLLGAAVLASVVLLILPAIAAASSAVTKPAMKVHHTTAVLNGHLDPEGDPEVTECLFEWGETVAYGKTVPCAQGSAFSAPADVSASLSGLKSDITYHFRLHIETTSSGPSDGINQSFTTTPVPTEHPLVANFGKDGTSGSEFDEFEFGVATAMDHAIRRLYGINWGNLDGALFGFNAASPPLFPPLAGFPRNTFGSREATLPIAIDNTKLGSAGNVYFYSEDTTELPWKLQINGLSRNGTPLPGFPIEPQFNPGPPTLDDNFGITGVAVRSNGEVWVALGFNDGDDILRYSAAGVYQGSVDVAGVTSDTEDQPRSIVFDSEDNLYVSFYGPFAKSVWKFTAASDYVSHSKLPDPPAAIWALAFDPSTEYLYATTSGDTTSAATVAVYDAPSGELFDEFQVVGGRGIAVDPANHYVYAGGNTKIHVYTNGASFLPPTATTAPASAITGSEATLNGFVDPEGEAVDECEFEYGLDDEYGQAVPCSPSPGSGSGDVAVSAEISGLDPNTTYHYRVVASNSSASDNGEDETFTTTPPPVISSPSVENLSYNSAKLKALVDPKGFETTYRFEYGTTSAYGTTVPFPDDGNVGAGIGDVAVSADIAGLEPDTVYHWRVVAENANGEVALPDQTFTTFGPVKVETTGSPIRTTTTAQLQGRVNPDGAPTTYRFEYGTAGPCDANPCIATPDRSAGSGGVYRFVAEQVEGLEPDTTYHYRVIAESSTPGGPAIGKGMTVTTRASDAPLSHGDLPGPPGSDRAYEQVSLPDTGGNPVFRIDAVSDDGNRAIYKVLGGTPLSVAGSTLTPLYAERVETGPHQGGWRSTNIYPSRQELVGSAWLEPAGRSDLSDQVTQNFDTTSGAVAIWRLRPGQAPSKLLQPTIADFRGPVAVSDDASRVLTLLRGSHDPARPAPNNEPNLYDITSGTPRLVGLMPDGSIPSCGTGIEGGGGGGGATVFRAPHWVSADGSRVFFLSCTGLYVRDLIAEETQLISSESGGFIKSTPDAAFFTTSQSLASGDVGGRDLYRYDLGDETLECVTCVVPGLPANVNTRSVVVSEDGSRVYFASSTELIRGAVSPGIYRVNLLSGDLVYVAPLGKGKEVTEDARTGGALTPDGSVFVFSSSDAGLNALGGQQNGGTSQLYRYDDRNRSLICFSCPQDGSAPNAEATENLVAANNELAGANRTALSADGDVFAFVTPTPLVESDQNTARSGQTASVGNDVYEWRDGRLFLVSDGLTSWTSLGPAVNAVSPSGRDVFFTAATQYTQDALDGYQRLYTARIGGGFEFPPPPRPCPLEVCQGTPKGAPEERVPGTDRFSGPGNTASGPARRSCAKGRHKIRRGGRTRCVKNHSRNKKQQKRQRAENDRRAQR